MRTDSTAGDLFGWQAPEPPPSYPQAAGFKGERDGPSERAAKIISRIVTGRRAEVLDYLKTKATEPMTADQIAVRLGRTPFSIRPRVAELHALGLIEPASERGKNESGMTANRWRAVQQ